MWAGLMAVGLTGGCRTMEFYAQAAAGQAEVFAKREPIERVIQKTGDESLRERLKLTQRLLDFAERELKMPAEGSFQSYTELGREHLVWVLYAAPELSLEPKQWWYPLVGCLNYRGYFSREMAEAEARRLEDMGYETFIGGVDAYSTLGWFRDPVLSTFVNRSEVSYAELIFHELAHIKYYVPSDTAFNEGLAQAVEREGVRRWLKATGRRSWVARYDARLLRMAEAREVIQATIERLRALYAQDFSDDRKRVFKAREIDRMRSKLMALDAGERSVLGAWVEGPINHAQLAAYSTYESEVPRFNELLDAVDGDFREFWKRVSEMEK